MVRNVFSKVSLKQALATSCAVIALAAATTVPDTAFAQGAGQGKQSHGAQGGGGGGHGGDMDRGSGRGQGLGGIFRDVTGMDDDMRQGGRPSDDAHSSDEGDDDSDRPEWAGQPGGKDGAGGGRPDTAGTSKGTLFGDLWVILRDENGVPILTDEGWVQPLDADGEKIPLDEEGHPVDESLTIEVELGRLNVGRAPTHVLDRRADEVITMLNSATDIDTDAAGRLVLTVDGVAKTIDSPLENLAIYVALLTQGSIPGVDDLPGSDYDFLIDGKYTAEDLAASTVFLAAATDKSGEFTSDEIAYIDAFLGINTNSEGDVTWSEIDYSTFSYDRESVYGDEMTLVLVEQADGSFVPEEVSVYEYVFGSENVSVSGDLDAYTVAADDARQVVNFIHEYAVPAPLAESE